MVQSAKQRSGETGLQRLETWSVKLLDKIMRSSPLRSIGVRIAVHEFAAQRTRKRGLQEIVGFAYGFPGIAIRPGQIRMEIMQLLKVLECRSPKFILEIGTSQGGTLYLFAQVASRDATIVSLDMPGGPFGGGYPEWKKPLYESFVKTLSQKVVLLRTNSHSTLAVERVEAILDGQMLDFLFIDGDHTYEGVRRDFELYSPLVAKGGIIAFHDIVRHPRETRCEVDRLWRELKRKYRFQEFVNDWNQNWAGIGVLYT